MLDAAVVGLTTRAVSSSNSSGDDEAKEAGRTERGRGRTLTAAATTQTCGETRTRTSSLARPPTKNALAVARRTKKWLVVADRRSSAVAAGWHRRTRPPLHDSHTIDDNTRRQQATSDGDGQCVRPFFFVHPPSSSNRRSFLVQRRSPSFFSGARRRPTFLRFAFVRHDGDAGRSVAQTQRLGVAGTTTTAADGIVDVEGGNEVATTVCCVFISDC